MFSFPHEATNPMRLDWRFGAFRKRGNMTKDSLLWLLAAPLPLLVTLYMIFN